MALTTKKFLDQSGTTYLWQKIAAELDKKGKLESVAAGDKSLTIGGTDVNRTVAVNVAETAGNALTLTDAGLYVATPAAQKVYSVVKDDNSGDFAAVYHLTVDKENTGVAINIPKDMVVSSGRVVTNPAGKDAGTYIELTLANATNDKLYIPVDSLIEYVTSGSKTGDMVVVAVSDDHKVTATITDGAVTKAKLESDVQTTLTKADNAVQKTDVVTGDTNGTIKVQGVEVAVKGLGSAAYTDSSAYDVAGAADAVYNAVIALTTTEIDNAIAAASSST